MPVDCDISAVTFGTSLLFVSCWDCWHSASWHPSTPLDDQKIQKQVPVSCLQRFGTPRLAPGPASLTNTPRFWPGNSLVSPLSFFYCSGQQDPDESVRPATNTQLRNEPKGGWREPHSHVAGTCVCLPDTVSVKSQVREMQLYYLTLEI